GDKDLNDPSPLKSMENVIVHNLRHVQTHRNTATAQIALQKLLNILRELGGRQFDRRRIYPRVRNILGGFQSADYSRLTAVEKQFLDHFHSLQIIEVPPSDDRPPDSKQLTLEFE